MPTPRYSREDMAYFMEILTSYADQDYASQPEVFVDVEHRPDEVWVAVPAKYLKGAAAALSEAANRAPTHQELVAGQLPRDERRVNAAERLCSIYWGIAVAAVGEEEVRRRRDEEIARIVSTGAQA